MKEIFNLIEKLPQEKADKLYKDIVRYILCEEEPKDLESNENLTWELLKFVLDNTY